MLASRGNHRDSHTLIVMIFFLLIPLLTLCGCQNTQDNNQESQAHNARYQSSTQFGAKSSAELDFRDSSDLRDFDKQDFEFFDGRDFARLDSSHKDKSVLNDYSIENLLKNLSSISDNQIFLLSPIIPAPANDDTSSSHKTILLFFGSPFCAPCKNIIQHITKSKALQEMLKSHYQAYFIDILSKESLQINLPSLIKKTHQDITHKPTQKIENLQKSTEIHTTKKSLSYALNIRATPTLLFLDKSGEEIFRFVGGLSKEHLLIALDFLKSPPTSNNQQQIALELHKRFLAQNK